MKTKTKKRIKQKYKKINTKSYVSSLPLNISLFTLSNIFLYIKLKKCCKTIRYSRDEVEVQVRGMKRGKPSLHFSKNLKLKVVVLRESRSKVEF